MSLVIFQPKVTQKNYINLPFLFNALANLVKQNKITLPIKCCLNNTNDQKILEVPLRSIPSDELMANAQWNATGDRQKAFTAVAKVMNQYLQHEEQQQEKSNLFNRLYNTNRTENIQYICI